MTSPTTHPVTWLRHAGQRLGLVPTLGGGVAAWVREAADGGAPLDLWRPWDGVTPANGVTVASPLDSSQRGGHVTLHHPDMARVVAALWERDVIPDYRDPHGLRIGLSPLSTSYDEVRVGLEAVSEVLAQAG